MSPLATLYVWTAVAVGTVIAVVTIDDAAADVAAGVVLLAGLAAIARTVIRLAGDPGP